MHVFEYDTAGSRIRVLHEIQRAALIASLFELAGRAKLEAIRITPEDDDA